MTTYEIPSIAVRPARAGRLRRARSRRTRAPRLRAFRRFLDGWTRRPSDEALSGLAARDRIGERF